MYVSSSINSLDASEILEGVLSIARQEHSYAVSIAIVDVASIPLCQHRMMAAPPSTYTAALHKAQTAMFFGRDTAAFHHERRDGTWRDKDSIDIAGDANRRACFPNFVSWAGGVLIDDRHGEGQVLGAIGISGLAQLEDDALAMRAIQAWKAKHEQGD